MGEGGSQCRNVYVPFIHWKSLAGRAIYNTFYLARSIYSIDLHIRCDSWFASNYSSNLFNKIQMSVAVRMGAGTEMAPTICISRENTEDVLRGCGRLWLDLRTCHFCKFESIQYETEFIYKYEGGKLLTYGCSFASSGDSHLCLISVSFISRTYLQS